MAKCWIMTQYQWLIVNSLMSLQFFIVFVPQPIYCKNGYLSYWKNTHIFSSIFFAAKLTSLFSKLSVSPLPVSGANSGDNNNRRNSICNGYAGARPRSSSFRFRRPSGSGLDEDAAGVQLRRRLENETVCQNFTFFCSLSTVNRSLQARSGLFIFHFSFLFSRLWKFKMYLKLL